MKFIADENFPIPAFKLLENFNLDIYHISHLHAGISDIEVIELAIKEQRIILTFDSDYGTLIFKNKFKPAGIVYFRLSTYTPVEPALMLIAILKEVKIKLEGNLTVIETETIRQRQIP